MGLSLRRSTLSLPPSADRGIRDALQPVSQVLHPDLVGTPLEVLRTRCLAYDTEATGLIPYGPMDYWGYVPARPFAFGFCDNEGNVATIRFPVDPMTRGIIIDNPRNFNALRTVLTDKSIIKVGHNLGYDDRMSRSLGIPLQGPMHDTQVLA